MYTCKFLGKSCCMRNKFGVILITICKHNEAGYTKSLWLRGTYLSQGKCLSDVARRPG